VDAAENGDELFGRLLLPEEAVEEQLSERAVELELHDVPRSPSLPCRPALR
jgi:hypothetical protein